MPQLIHPPTTHTNSLLLLNRATIEAINSTHQRLITLKETSDKVQNIAMSAQEVYHQFIYQLRSSNLNFVLSETPYSAQILLRILQGLRVAQAAVTERWP